MRLAIHPHIVRSLIQTGWLEGRVRRFDKVKKIAVHQSTLAIFEQSYILVGMLALRWQVNPTNLAEKLKSLGVQPVAGPGIDQLATSLFRLDEVAHLCCTDIISIKDYPTRAGRRQVNSLAKPSSEGMLLPEAAMLLGVSQQQVLQLLRKNILKRTTKIHRPVLIERDSAWKLVRTLQRKDLIPLAEAAQIIGCGLPWFRSNWIITGLVTVLNLGLWHLVQREDIERIQCLRRDYLTATEAGRMLNMHRSHLPNLEKQGLVKSLRMGKNGRLRLYERASVKALRIDHVKPEPPPAQEVSR